MVAVLVALTILALLTAEYVLVRNRGARVVTEDVPQPALRSLSETVASVPAGLFLHPTFTWGRLETDGRVTVGIHPLLLGLVGTPLRLDRRAAGDVVSKGLPFIRLGSGDKELTVRSPVSGRIAEVNSRFSGDWGWPSVDEPNGHWLYRIEPEAIGDDIRHWMVSTDATAWTRRQLDQLRWHLERYAQRPDIGLVMADGGDLPVGVLSQLDERAWRVVQKTFL